MSGEEEQTFSEFFSFLMQDRKVSSDERLAQKAMAQQAPGRPRLNVHARSINNWRNGRSKPRSIEDRKLQLVLKALGATEDEMARLAHLLVLDECAKEGETAHNTPSVGPSATHGTDPMPASGRLWIQPALFFVGLTVSLLVLSAFLLWGIGDGGSARYLDRIPPQALALSEDGFVLPGSDVALVRSAELEGLSGWALYVARNEIFARHGRPFVKASSVCLQNHFNQWRRSASKPDGWYDPRTGNPNLTDLELRNADLILKYECKQRGGTFNCSGEIQPCG